MAMYKALIRKLQRQNLLTIALAAIMTVGVTALSHLIMYGYDQRFFSDVTIAFFTALIVATPIVLHLGKQRQRLIRLTRHLRDARRELRAANRALHFKASIDGMTGLPNRESFLSKVEARRSDAENNVMMIVDADRFKAINDSYGHLVGDEALYHIVRVLKKLRRADDVVGRIGGEEFGIFLPDTSQAEGQIIAEMIRCEIENVPFEPHPGIRHVLTVSIGITTTNVVQDRSTTLRHADIALFEAKRRGRNCCVVYEPGMLAHRPVRLAATPVVAANVISRERAKAPLHGPVLGKA